MALGMVLMTIYDDLTYTAAIPQVMVERNSEQTTVKYGVSRSHQQFLSLYGLPRIVSKLTKPFQSSGWVKRLASSSSSSGSSGSAEATAISPTDSYVVEEISLTSRSSANRSFLRVVVVHATTAPQWSRVVLRVWARTDIFEIARVGVFAVDQQVCFASSFVDGELTVRWMTT